MATGTATAADAASGTAAAPAVLAAPAAVAAREPKRQRGRLRVAAILDAGMAVFAEKGFDAATMTEIAARSGTAIGSLYRFFPTKEALADALLVRFSEHMGAALAAIERDAADRAARAVADALVDLMLDRKLKTERAAAVALVDTRSDGAHARAQFRSAVRCRLAAIVAAVNPALPPGRVDARAAVLQQMLKAVPALAEEDASGRKGVVAELRAMMQRCLSAPADDED